MKIYCQRELETLAERQEPFYILHEAASEVEASAAPQRWRKTLPMWIVLALIASFGLAFVLEYMDTNLYTDYDVKRHLNMTCLGLIETQPRGESPILLHLSPRSLLAERFNMSATILRTHMVEQDFKTVAICSAIPREGKTTVAVDMAIALARKGLQVILIDADLRLPQVHEVFGVPNERGLSTYLQAEPGTLDIRSFAIATSEPNLHLLPSGEIPGAPIQLLESAAMVELTKELREQYDVVLFDTPPITDVSDTLTIATLVDTSVLVIGSGLSDRRRATWAKQLLGNVRANISGALLNFASHRRGGQYYYYYQYGYGYYGYGGRKKTVRER